MNRKVLVIAGVSLLVLLILVLAIRQVKRDKDLPQADALYNTALSLQAKGELEKAVGLYQGLLKQFPSASRAAQAWYKLGEIYESENLWQKAKDAYSKIVVDFPNFKQISDVEKRLWDLNIKILFSPIITKHDIVYKVEPQDTLGKIAAEYNSPVDLIMRSNNLKSTMIRPGKRLKISTRKYSVIVDKSQNSLTLKADDAIFKVYPVATGKYNCTPTGSFTVVEKLKNPVWYKSGEGVIAASNPKNILGTRWLGLSEPQYGIHGGATEQDLNKHLTEGCIRMTNAAVEELFTILPRGTEVTIVE